MGRVLPARRHRRAGAALVRLYQELGGQLRLNAPVDLVEVEQHGDRARHLVTSRGREREPFRAVVSNADLHHTYAHLYRKQPAAEAMRAKLEKSEWSMSLFVLYFGTDRSYPIAHHNVLFGPRYRELLGEIFHGHSLPEDFSLYPARADRDGSVARAARWRAYYVLSPVPHLGNARLDWDTLGPRYAERILTALERWMPDLRRHVVVQRITTPMDFERGLFAYQGSAFSLAPLLTQSAWFRPHNKDAQIPGLYLVGAGTHPVPASRASWPRAKRQRGWFWRTSGMSVELARSMLARGSKSFALAARVLPPSCRDDVAVLYAYCRRADDLIDDATAAEQPARIEALSAELASVYARELQTDPVLAEFQRVVFHYVIPEGYPRALLDGFRSDVGVVRIGTLAELLLYAHRVAGVVGLMSCRVFGVHDARALEHANHLGIAMQLTNVCRDVAEDWGKGRVYLPSELLGSAAGAPLEFQSGTRVELALRRLLELADRYYASGDRSYPRCRSASRSPCAPRVWSTPRSARASRRRATTCTPAAPSSPDCGSCSWSCARS